MIIQGILISLVLIPLGILLIRFRGKLGKADVDSQRERQKSLFKGTKHYSRKADEKTRPAAYRIQNALYLFLGAFCIAFGIFALFLSLLLY